MTASRLRWVGTVLLVATSGCSYLGLTGPDSPPDLVVSSGDNALSLGPMTFCWIRSDDVSVCGDGGLSDPLPRLVLNERSEMQAQFPLPWTLEASIGIDGDLCGPVTGVSFDPVGVPVAIPGSQGVHTMKIFGRGFRGEASWIFAVELLAPGLELEPYLVVSLAPAAESLGPTAELTVQLFNLGAHVGSASVAVAGGAPGSEDEVFDLLGRADEGVCPPTAFETPESFSNDLSATGPPPYELTVTFDVEGALWTSDPIVWPDDFPPDSRRSAIHYGVIPEAGLP